MKTFLAILASTLLVTPMLFGQGALAPTGAPGPLMKSLDQIEPRIPITSLPYFISTSGSYYFTKNLQFTDTSGSAISIYASDVTLDLGGFTLSSTAAVTGRAIDIGSVRGVTVKNGYITGNTTVVVSGTAPSQTWTTTAAGFDSGIVDYATGSRYQDLGIRGCRFAGLYVANGRNAVIDKVSVSTNGNYGIYSQFSSISNCTVNSNGGVGIDASSGSVTNSTATSNATYGIYASYGSVTNATASSNGNTGIYAEQGSVTNSTARSNAGHGISANAGSVINSTATSNGGIGINADSGSVTSSTAISNGNYGIWVSNGSVINSTAVSNASNGIEASLSSVTSSTARNNGGYGITAYSSSITNSTSLNNTGPDLGVSNGVVAFCKAGTRSVAGCTLTGNLPTP